MTTYNNGDTFEDHLRKTGSVAKSQTNRHGNQGSFSPKIRFIFDEIGPEDTKKVLVFWHMMLKAYGAGMKATYGDEPDAHFVELAVSLTKKDMQRVADNIQDLLLHNKTFAPAHENLRMLSQRPTRSEINIARRDLHERPRPLRELNRVNKYIREFHIAKIKALKLEGFDYYFEKFYVQIWREVMIFNADMRTRSQQDAVKHSIENSEGNRFDKLVEENLKNGKAFDNPFGERIAKIMANKKEQKTTTFDEDPF